MANSLWLNLRSQQSNTVLQEHHQALESVQNFLEAPEAQEPQMISFIGSEVKCNLLEDLFNIKRKSGHNKIHVECTKSTPKTRSPIIVADCELHNLTQLNEEFSSRMQSHIEHHILRWIEHGVLEPKLIASLVYSHLIIPFSTVVCLFADDFGGPRGVANAIASWLAIPNTQSQDLSSYPRILVLQRWKDASATFDEKLATLALLDKVRFEINTHRSMQGKDSLDATEVSDLVRRHLGRICLLNLPISIGGEVISFHKHINTLRQRILQESEEVHLLRKTANISFTALHFASFFNMACKHFTSTIHRAFDFINASRKFNPVSDDLSSHVSEFFSHLGADARVTFGASVLASAICLDSLPPQMHKFDASAVFDTLYSEHLLATQCSTEQLANVKRLFCQQYNSISRHSRTSVAAHQTLLASFSSIWKHTFSNATCLSCLTRRPEYVLSCNHSFCCVCVSIYSQSDSDLPWTPVLQTCPLCLVQNYVEIHLKPSTAGIRCLLIDGAGNKDIEILKEIQKRIALPMNIQEHFDMVLGAGTGVLLVMDLFCNQLLSSNHCTELSTLVENYSQPRSAPSSRFSQSSTMIDAAAKKGTWSNIVKISRVSFPQLKDLKLASQTVAPSLKQIFAPEKTLFSGYGGGRKIGVAVVQDIDSSLRIMSNYYLPVPRCGSLLSRGRSIGTLYHIARAVTARKSFRGYRFQESLSFKEMPDIIIREQDHIWSRNNKVPDVVCCIGTEIAAYEKPIMLSTWAYDYRFQKRVFSDTDTVDTFLAALFYLELVSAPQINDIGFRCRARIRCRLTPLSPAYLALTDKLRRNNAYFYFDCQRVPCTDGQLRAESEQGIAFSRYIEFTVRNLQTEVDIQIYGLTSRGKSISNCPYLVQTLIEDQGLNCKFGHKDHKTRYFGYGSRSRDILSRVF